MRDSHMLRSCSFVECSRDSNICLGENMSYMQQLKASFQNVLTSLATSHLTPGLVWLPVSISRRPAQNQRCRWVGNLELIPVGLCSTQKERSGAGGRLRLLLHRRHLVGERDNAYLKNYNTNSEV